MLLDIRAAFDEMVTELDWMDADTRARAHKKLHAMRPFIGVPDWITNHENLNKFYEEVSSPEIVYDYKVLLIQFPVCLDGSDRREAARNFFEANWRGDEEKLQ